MALRRRPAGLSWLFAASVILGAAILVRPVGYALLGVAPLIGLVWHGRRWAAVGAATLPAIAMLLAVSSWNLVNKGYFATQLFDGYNIGKHDHTLPAISPVNLSMDVTTITCRSRKAEKCAVMVNSGGDHPASSDRLHLSCAGEFCRVVDIAGCILRRSPLELKFRDLQSCSRMGCYFV